MSYAWLMAPHEYEPDYDAYLADLASLEKAMANVATYDDWFVDLPGTKLGDEPLPQLLLIHHLAESMTDRNWKDYRLQILRAAERCILPVAA